MNTKKIFESIIPKVFKTNKADSWESYPWATIWVSAPIDGFLVRIIYNESFTMGKYVCHIEPSSGGASLVIGSSDEGIQSAAVELLNNLTLKGSPSLLNLFDPQFLIEIRDAIISKNSQ
jgi:hypothetical protein